MTGLVTDSPVQLLTSAANTELGNFFEDVKPFQAELEVLAVTASPPIGFLCRFGT